MKLHFEECPYGCNKKGKLFDRALSTFLNCPYCEKKREELANSGLVESDTGEKVSIQKELGFNDPYLSTYFDFDLLISESERPLLDPSTLQEVREAIDSLRGIISRGDLPSKSYCFGLARKGFVDKLAFPLLATAYEKGIGKGKFISSRIYYSYYMQEKDLQEYYDVDLLFVLINSGSSYRELKVLVIHSQCCLAVLHC